MTNPKTPKGPGPAVSKSAFRDANGNLRVSGDHIEGRAKDPIFGPAVPAGEEVEFERRDFHAHGDVRDCVSETVDLVLNGIMPQAKGEFVLRAMAQVTKSLIAQQDASMASGANSAIGRLLQQDKGTKLSPEAAEFEAMARDSAKKMKGKK
jgi:hypothetical protein